MNTLIGIDPGGIGAIGWCVMETTDALDQATLKTGTGSNISDVVEGLARLCPDAPIGAGIDAPLYWSRSGERQSDRVIRKAVKNAGGHAATVSHVNSLRGACLVQGVLAILALNEYWPEIQITESHPKALLAVWSDAREFVRPYKFANDHERDASLGAYAAYAHWQKSPKWINWFDIEEDVFVPSGSSVSYWFPRT